MKFGRWTVLERAEDHITKSGYHFTQWRCVCECGKVKTVYANALLSGKSKSCGCYHNEKSKKTCKENFSTHGESQDRLYKIWSYMKKRCLNPKASNYKDYGGRGITVCDEWKDYETFREWANEHGYSDDLSIDRIDVNGNYTPDNCRWVTTKQQNNNRRSNVFYTFDGERHTVSEWADIVGVTYKCMYSRLKRNKTPYGT